MFGTRGEDVQCFLTHCTLKEKSLLPVAAGRVSCVQTITPATIQAK